MAICPQMISSSFERFKQVAAKDPQTLNPYERYYLEDPGRTLQADAYLRISETIEEMGIDNEFWGPSTKTMIEAGARLNKMELETLMNIEHQKTMFLLNYAYMSHEKKRKFLIYYRNRRIKQKER